MNMHVPTGPELMIKTILKFIGIKPEQILEPLSEIRVIAVNADTRLNKLQADLDTIKRHLGIEE